METEKRPRQRIIRKPELLNMIGLSDPTVWRMEKEGRFPKRLRLGGNSCGWLESEILEWLDNRAAARGFKA
jgi:prophage regulatory protein